MNEKARQIIDSAIKMIRKGGYHSFSFRQIATELEVKSASIHYHFPSKEDLGVAVTEHYTEMFLGSLNEPHNHQRPVDFYIQAFQSALENHESGCVCGILAAEAGRLPESMRGALASFTRKNIEWLELALRLQCPDWSEVKVRDSAVSMFSTLEGGIIFAALSRDPAHLRQIGDWLKKICA